MAEYIEREALFKHIEETVVFSGRPNTVSAEMRGARTVIDRIKSAPAADVVEVVRCEDCLHWGGVSFGQVCKRWSGIDLKNHTQPKDFCSCGERKDGAE